MSDKICLYHRWEWPASEKAAAIQLAQQGVKVIIGCRNEQKARAALKEIKEKSGTERSTCC
ncbi:MAG: hypothetical protein U5K84_12460 [Alkalibacterium sp.]|nr:hypothetical protein [Alkalibacterium sp.]